MASRNHFVTGRSLYSKAAHAVFTKHSPWPLLNRRQLIPCAYLIWSESLSVMKAIFFYYSLATLLLDALSHQWTTGNIRKHQTAWPINNEPQMTARKSKLNQIKNTKIGRQKSGQHKIERNSGRIWFPCQNIADAWHGLGHTTTTGQSRRLSRLAVAVAVCVWPRRHVASANMKWRIRKQQWKQCRHTKWQVAWVNEDMWAEIGCCIVSTATYCQFQMDR